MPINETLSDALIDWYWEHGCKRQGAHVLKRGSWLDRLLHAAEEAGNIKESRNIYNKPTMALWGPSQSGKSTLLADFLNQGGDDKGNGSALSWHPDCPALFSGKDDGTTAILNPYNNGADASGCVTRFQLRDSVKFEKHPVEVSFASEHEILLYLAVGYLSETIAKNENDELVTLSAVDLTEIAAKHTRKCRSAAPDKEAYKLLTSVLNVLDVLIDMEEPRYINLRNEWQARRKELLDNDKLVSDSEYVINFTAEILWDSWSNMTSIYKKLSAKRKELGNKKVYCGIDIATLLLDIASVQKYYLPIGGEYIRNKVQQIRVKEVEDDSVILHCGDEGNAMFKDGEDFGLVQGLVSLIVVPLRKDVIARCHPAIHALLEKADLLDFPGVANEYKGSDLLTNDQLAMNYTDEYKARPINALTKVMKRGKTASIVVGSSRKLNIDAFSLLVRMPAGKDYPAHPVQLKNGINCWFNSMGLKLDHLQDGEKLPINLLLTFSAQLLNTVAVNGTGKSGLVNVFGKLNTMGMLANPDIVTPYCVNYPQFPDGVIQIKNDEEKQNVIDKIRADVNFAKLFKGTEDSLNAMADLQPDQYGGRVFLFESITQQLSTKRRSELLEQKMAKLEEVWDACMREALPPRDEEDNARIRDIELLINTLQSPPEAADELINIARTVQDFQNVVPSKLEILPNTRLGVHNYVTNMINSWLEDAKGKPLQTCIGFKNEEHRTRILTYLYGRINAMHADLCTWMESLYTNRDINRADERSECRRLMATCMANLLFPANNKHRDINDCVNLLNRITIPGKGTGVNHPYYISVIAPFCQVLEQLKLNDDEISRGYQAGDNELSAMLQPEPQQ